MTLFLLGFMSAVALLVAVPVGVLFVYLVKAYRRQQAHQQAATDAIMAKVAADQPDGFPPIYVGPMAKRPTPGKKGIH